jgi:DNA primase
MLKDVKVNVPHLLERLGMRNITDGYDEWAFSCPFPGHAMGDERPSAYMNAETTAWMCHGCKKRGNAVSFVAEVENVSPMTAARWLRDAYGEGFKEPEGGSMVREYETFFTPKQDADKELINPPLSADVSAGFYVNWQRVGEAKHDLDALPPALAYPLRRGLEPRTLTQLGFGLCRISGRLSFEVHDEDGALIGFKGRAIDPDDQPKYLVLGDRKATRWGFKPYKVAHVVYLLHRATPDATGTLVVIEGELNTARLWQGGMHNVCGLGGSELSPFQADLIAERSDRVVLYLDSDAAGTEGREKAVHRLESRVPTFVVPSHEGDAMSLPFERSVEFIENAVSSLLVGTLHP